LDLENPAAVDSTLRQRFDVVFNHTTLEHVYEVHTALDNICALSRDIVILVVPTLQLVHAVPDPTLPTPINQQYSDYWRFTPHLLIRLLEDRGLSPLILVSNSRRRSSVYTFCVASRRPSHWSHIAQPLCFVDGTAPRWVKQPLPGWNSTRTIALVEITQVLLRNLFSRLPRLTRKRSSG
jgi:hypothetical protein